MPCDCDLMAAKCDPRTCPCPSACACRTFSTSRFSTPKKQKRGTYENTLSSSSCKKPRFRWIYDTKYELASRSAPASLFVGPEIIDLTQDDDDEPFSMKHDREFSNVKVKVETFDQSQFTSSNSDDKKRCPQCTFHNDFHARSCAICSHSLPLSRACTRCYHCHAVNRVSHAEQCHACGISYYIWESLTRFCVLSCPKKT